MIGTLLITWGYSAVGSTNLALKLYFVDKLSNPPWGGGGLNTSDFFFFGSHKRLMGSPPPGNK